MFLKYPEPGFVQYATVSAAACCFRTSIQSEIFMEGHDFIVIKVTNVKIKDFNVLTH
jgi:hypothetical protein